ncbi:MAG: hypothetical protein UX77_C0001G0013 [Parcubacteria group bacterium GW2011_GWA1_47_11]|nr:MAG: hypothetical protein UX77_C0001G0013 [Parcubacteria group bacterium GW2011_GWA1_47_11]
MITDGTPSELKDDLLSILCVLSPDYQVVKVVHDGFLGSEDQLLVAIDVWQHEKRSVLDRIEDDPLRLRCYVQLFSSAG